MAARHFAMVHEEAVWGTPSLTTGAPTTGRYNYVRLDQYQSEILQITRNKVDVPRGDGKAGRGMVVTQPGGEATAQLKFILTWTDIERMLGWAAVLINSGKTAPWAVDSGQTVGDLASCGFYEAIERANGTLKRRLAYGGKVAKWTLACSRQNPLVLMTYDLVFGGVKEDDTLGGTNTSDPDATEFPDPGDNGFATNAVIFQHLDGDGGLTIGTERSNISSLEIEVTNPLSIYKGASPWPEIIRHIGARDVVLRATLLHKHSPDDRASYESQTAQDVQVKFASGAMSVLFDFNAANYISEPPKLTMQPGMLYEQNVVIQNYRDTAETTDLVVTIDDTP
mgnify:FL=1